MNYAIEVLEEKELYLEIELKYLIDLGGEGIVVKNRLADIRQAIADLEEKEAQREMRREVGDE